MLSQHTVGGATAHARVGVLGVKLYGAVEVGNGFGIALLLVAQETAVVPEFGALGIEPDGLLVVLQCPFGVAQGITRDAAIVVAIGIARSECYGLGEEFHLAFWLVVAKT